MHEARIDAVFLQHAHQLLEHRGLAPGEGHGIFPQVITHGIVRENPFIGEILHGIHLKESIQVLFLRLPGNANAVHARICLHMRPQLQAPGIQLSGIGDIHHCLDEVMLCEQCSLVRIGPSQDQDIRTDARLTQFQCFPDRRDAEEIDPVFFQHPGALHRPVSIGIVFHDPHDLRALHQFPDLTQVVRHGIQVHFRPYPLSGSV